MKLDNYDDFNEDIDFEDLEDEDDDGLELEDDEELDVEGLDDETDDGVDDKQDKTGDSDDQEEEEDIEVDVVDDQEYDEDDTTSKPKAKRKLTKAEKVIIDLKRQNRELKRQQAKEKDKQEQEAERKKIYDKLVDDGMEESVAKVYADNELRVKQLERKQALLDFREYNADILARYPQSRDDIEIIMRNTKVTGMSVEQVLRGLYGASEPYNDTEARALKAARGQAGTVNATRKSASNKQTTSEPRQTLTRSDLAYKKALEEEFMNGKEMTMKEFLRIKGNSKASGTVTQKKRSIEL